MTTIDTIQAERAATGAKQDKARAASIPGFVCQAVRMGADFELPIHTPEQFTAALRAIGGHNRFDVERTIKAFCPLIPSLMRVSIKHYNAGPDLYFEIPYTSQQIIAARHGWKGPTVTFTPEDRIEQTQLLIDLGRALYADEISTTQNPGTDENPVQGAPGPRPYRVRL